MAGHFYNHIQANDNSRLQLGNIYNYGDRERLKHVRGAVFDAYGLDHRACHPATRREPLEEIQGWAEHSSGRSIFWLNGMAGTGKSTIAYSVAERLNQRGTSARASLGASFFFKRGERDRTSAALFFPTIVRQLGHRIPEFAAHVDWAIDMDPDVCSKALGEQFNKLLKEPFQKLGDCLSTHIYVVVVDALDECQSEDDIRTLLRLWSYLPQSPHARLRLFVTSRPELAIRLGFAKISADTHYDIDPSRGTATVHSAQYSRLSQRQAYTDKRRLQRRASIRHALPATWPGSAGAARDHQHGRPSVHHCRYDMSFRTGLELESSRPTSSHFAISANWATF